MISQLLEAIWIFISFHRKFRVHLKVMGVTIDTVPLVIYMMQMLLSFIMFSFKMTNSKMAIKEQGKCLFKQFLVSAEPCQLTWLTCLQDEVNRLIALTLGEREREIIRLYYGLDKECLTWEDISKR